MIVDNHGHISQLEVQDVVDEYDKNYSYGMSHRDNLFLMDAVGVDMQVLHCSGYLHRYHRRVLQEHPDRFAAIAKIDEPKLPGDEGLELIRMYVEDWGFKGWYYDPWAPEMRVANGYSPKDWGLPDPFYHFDHERYDPQWELVQSLGVPACITCYPQNFDTVGPALLNVFKKFPDLTVVLIHGIDPPSCLRDDGAVAIPESAVRLIREHDVYLDLLTGPRRAARQAQPLRPQRRGAQGLLRHLRAVEADVGLGVHLHRAAHRRPVPLPVRLRQRTVRLHDRRRPRPGPRRERPKGVRPLTRPPSNPPPKSSFPRRKTLA